jgi:sulfite reductase (NADPH) hemoprotein beta-component
VPPGDMTSAQMDLALADLADAVSFGLIRVAHDQNLLLDRRAPGGPLQDLARPCRLQELATANIGTLDRHDCLPGT